MERKNEDGYPWPTFGEGTATARYHSDVLNLPDDRLVGGDDRDRDRPMQVPVWWLREVNRRVDVWKEKTDQGLHELGLELTKAAKRDKAWTHGTVSKCLRAKLVTDKLVEALAAFFEMPPHTYHPASLSEALALQNAARGGTSRVASSSHPMPLKPTPDANGAAEEMRSRYDEKLQALEREPRSVSAGARQTTAVFKANEEAWGPGKPGRRRTAGVVPSRKAARRG